MRDLGWLSRLNSCEAIHPLRGRFYPNNQWATRHVRRAEPPLRDPRDQQSLAKRAGQEREGAKQTLAGVKEKEERAPAFRTDHRTIQQCRTIRALHQRELWRLQHRVQFIVQDMAKCGRLCNEETSVGFAPSEARWKSSDAMAHPPTPSRTTPRWDSKEKVVIIVVDSATPERSAACEQWSARRRRWTFVVCKKQASPLAFTGAPHRQRKRMLDRDRRGHRRRRQKQRAACSETVEDASSSSPDTRLKSKLRTCRQRPAHKYIITRHHEVSSFAVICRSLSLHRSVLTHIRETHRSLGQKPTCCHTHLSDRVHNLSNTDMDR